MSHHLAIVGLLLGAVAFGIACGESVTLTPLPTATPTSIPPVVIIDENSNQVTFQDPPQRIIAYDSALVEILFKMGEGSRVVGTHDFVSYPLEAEKVPRVGSSFQINAEKILELEPDLIYTFYGSSVPDLEALGVKVLYLETPTDLEGIAEQIRIWGRITRNESAAEQVAQDFESKIQALRNRLAALETGPRIFHDDSEFFTRGPDTLLGKVYTMLKAENIAHDVSLFGQLTPESIVERDPHVIVTTFPERPREFLNDPAFKDVSAVKEGRVYAIDGDLVSIAGPRFAEAIEDLARLLHPDVFQ